MNRCRPSKGALRLAFLATLSALAARSLADGGVVRVREATGPFLVTVFSTPAAPTAGLVDLSVMVQSGETGEMYLDAEVDLVFNSPPGVEDAGREMFCTPDGTQIRAVGTGGGARSRVIPATRKRATNKLLYAATVNLPAAGEWQMRVRVRRGSSVADVHCALPVAAGAAGFASVWPFVVTPFLIMGVFVCHQRLRRRASPEWRVTPELCAATT